MKHMHEERRRMRAEAFLENVDASLNPPREEPATHVLSQNAVKVLVKAALESGKPLIEVYESQGLHPSEGRAALDELVAQGMVRLHRMPRKGRGGQPIVVEVLPSGIEELAKRGITPAEKVLKRGGFKHDLYARMLIKWAKARGYSYWLERTLGQKAFDFVYEDGAGLHAIEIALSGTAVWNAKQAIKGAGTEGVRDVVIACEEKKFLTQVLEAVAETDALGLYRKKIVGKLLKEFIL